MCVNIIDASNNPNGCFKDENFGKKKKTKTKAESFVMQLDLEETENDNYNDNQHTVVGEDNEIEFNPDVIGDAPTTRGRRTASFHTMSNVATHFGREKRRTTKLTMLLVKKNRKDSFLADVGADITGGGEDSPPRRDRMGSFVVGDGGSGGGGNSSNLDNSRHSREEDKGAEEFKELMQRRRNSSSWTRRERRRSSSGKAFMGMLGAIGLGQQQEAQGTNTRLNPVTGMSIVSRRGTTAASVSAEEGGRADGIGKSANLSRFGSSRGRLLTTRISNDGDEKNSRGGRTGASKKLIVDRNFRLWVICKIQQPNTSDSVHTIDEDSIEKECFTANSHVVWSERVPSDAEHAGETQQSLATAIEGMKREVRCSRWREASRKQTDTGEGIYCKFFFHD